MTVIVFAYGSNMLTARIKSRVASARPIGTAFLPGYALRWHKRSKKDGSGKCSIEETGINNDCVWGVLYELSADDKSRLDKFEGLGSGYGEREVEVVLKGGKHSALAYYATSVETGIRPYTWYREQVVAGAREHGIAEEYICSLAATTAISDPDRKRETMEREFLAVTRDASK
jgi:hypothetical protein